MLYIGKYVSFIEGSYTFHSDPWRVSYDPIKVEPPMSTILESRPFKITTKSCFIVKLCFSLGGGL